MPQHPSNVQDLCAHQLQSIAAHHQLQRLASLLSNNLRSPIEELLLLRLGSPALLAEILLLRWPRLLPQLHAVARCHEPQWPRSWPTSHTTTRPGASPDGTQLIRLLDDITTHQDLHNDHPSRRSLTNALCNLLPTPIE